MLPAGKLPLTLKYRNIVSLSSYLGCPPVSWVSIIELAYEKVVLFGESSGGGSYLKSRQTDHVCLSFYLSS